MTDTATADARHRAGRHLLRPVARDRRGGPRRARRPVFTADGRHVDPLADANGHDELAAMMANVHAHYPGFAIERTSGIDQHGDQLRFAWQLDAADGTTLVAGIDVAEVAADGRLARVAGLLGRSARSLSPDRPAVASVPAAAGPVER